MPVIGEIQKGKDLGFRGESGNRKMWTACEVCGYERWVTIRRGQPISRQCRKCCYRENHPAWKGGRRTKDDYVYINLGRDSFFSPMTDKGGWILEHRLVIAKHLNRCLLPWEAVHHRNGVKNDNKVENLELLSAQKEHLPSTLMQREIKMLKMRVERLDGENRRLRDKVYG